MQLSFKLFGVPVRILPSFLITTLVINVGLAQSDLLRFVLWTAIVTGSVLVHEVGHAATGLAFGLQPRIDLHGFGGTTSWAAGAPMSPGRRILISLAGPGMGFLAGAVVALVVGVFGPGFGYLARVLPAAFGLAPALPERSLADFVYPSLLFVNLGWGLLNLLPILPLDGGNVLAQAFALTGRGERPARIISLAIALLAMIGAGLLWMIAGWGGWWPMLLAATFALTNWQALKDGGPREPPALSGPATPGAPDAPSPRAGIRRG